MIDPFRLPQVFVLPQELDFAQLRAAMSAIGFQEVPTGVQFLPLIHGEPELAAWEWPGGLPKVEYSFNPVVRLRILDVGTVPPKLRGVLDEALGHLTDRAVREILESSDDRQRLFGIWAAIETERLDLIYDIARIAETERGSLRDEAETALFRLGDLADLRLETQAGSRLIAISAMELLDGFSCSEVVRAHLPTAADCRELFVPEIAGRVADALATHRWPKRPITAQPVSPEDVHAAPAGLLRWPNEISDHFPMGYRTIAGWMTPSRIWLSWQGTEPDGGVVQMDGLVFSEGRWIFFPKPFRIVERLLPDMPSPAETRMY